MTTLDRHPSFTDLQPFGWKSTLGDGKGFPSWPPYAPHRESRHQTPRCPPNRVSIDATFNILRTPGSGRQNISSVVRSSSMVSTIPS